MFLEKCHGKTMVCFEVPESTMVNNYGNHFEPLYIVQRTTILPCFGHILP